MTAAGGISNTQELLRVMLSKCYYFQKIQGRNYNESQALARVYNDALPPPLAGGVHTLAELNNLRPFALVYTDDQEGYTLAKIAGDVGHCFQANGKLVIVIEVDVPSGIVNDPSAVDQAFKNDIGRILRSNDYEKPGLVELTGSPGTLIINRLAVIGPVRTDISEDDQLGDAQRVWIEVTWGLN